MHLTRMLSLLAASTAVACGMAAAAAGATPKLPDLRVWGVVDPPSQLAVGQQFSEEIFVRNIGAAKTTATGRTDLYLSENPRTLVHAVHLGSVALPRLKQGHESIKGTRLQLPADTPVSPEYFVLVCTDTTHRVHERNEDNNCLSSAISMEVVAAR